MKLETFDLNAKKTGDIEVSDNVFGIVPNEHVVHMAVVQYLANNRQGTKGSKTRAEVRGGGRKPWRQKGTGRARQGSIRSPQWTGGGVVFAPKARDFSFKLNKKVKRLAMKSVFSAKAATGKVKVLDELSFNEVKTKQMQNVLNAFDVQKAIFVTADVEKNVVLSSRNIPNIKTSDHTTISPYELLKYDNIFVTKAAVDKIQEVYA